ncbi:nucleoid-associated protein [Herbaspirillum seropedicae]|uniref:nucleoid-associated protein n=1 Tax=Herbaspirillum seropedicae TaxID=964 RepID=UPI003F8D1502
MADFEFTDMIIDRMAAHTIHVRGVGNVKVNPTCSNELIIPDADSADVLQMRLTAALGHRSHGVTMTINKTNAESFFHKTCSIMGAPDDDFLAMSKDFAVDLTEAQTSSRWPGGILIVISGKVGNPSKPFVAAIKAETDKGFSVIESGGRITLQLVKKMLLSETQRLYKVGMLIERAKAKPGADGLYSPDNYYAFLFDHLLTGNELGKAAAYFYDAFLGLNISKSDSHHTRVFYEKSIEYINGCEASDADKYAYREAVRAELRSQTISLSLQAFADRTFPDELGKSFVRKLKDEGFPGRAIVKDTEYIKKSLRRPRNVVFTSGVLIKVPTDREFKDLVDIGEPADGHTVVKITGAVERRE